MIWLVLAGMTSAALGMLLWPLWRRQRNESVSTDAHVDIYRAQIAEIDRDLAIGRLASGDAGMARTEAGRRLLQEDRPRAAPGVSKARQGFATVAVVAVCGAGLLLYMQIGSPALPDAPLSARKALPAASEFAASMAKIEAHLADSPDDLRGWTVVAPIYLRLGRSEEAVRAYANILRLGGDTAERRTDFAEAQVYVAQGVVTGDARRNFETALALDAANTKARYYMGLAAEQDGDRDKAREIWSKLADEAPEGSALSKALAERVAGLDTAATADTIAALPSDSQQVAIRGMVERLAGRLQENRSDIEGWLRLVRAYRVLDETEKARAALADARKSFTSDGSAKARLDALARELGLES